MKKVALLLMAALLLWSAVVIYTVVHSGLIFKSLL